MIKATTDTSVTHTHAGDWRRSGGRAGWIFYGREDDLWFVQATDEDDRKAVGNPHRSLDDAIANGRAALAAARRRLSVP